MRLRSLRPLSGLSNSPLALALCFASLASSSGSALRASTDPEIMDRRLSRAERSLERGDYPAAGEMARGILAQGSAPDSIRGPALTVLGKVLFFNSRVRLQGEDDTEESRRSRQEGLELAERALRDAIALGGPWALEARLYLADLLPRLDRAKEGREELTKYFEELGPEKPAPRARHLRECEQFWSTHAGVPIHNYHGGPGMTPPERISQNQPRYTEAAREAFLRGVVIVQVIIDREGEVVCAVPLIGMPLGLTEATLETLHDWRYKPARLDGEPIPVFYNLSTNFRLDTMRARSW